MKHTVNHLREVAEELLGKNGLPYGSGQLEADLLAEAELRGPSGRDPRRWNALPAQRGFIGRDRLTGHSLF